MSETYIERTTLFQLEVENEPALKIKQEPNEATNTEDQKCDFLPLPISPSYTISEALMTTNESNLGALKSEDALDIAEDVSIKSEEEAEGGENQKSEFGPIPLHRELGSEVVKREGSAVAALDDDNDASTLLESKKLEQLECVRKRSSRKKRYENSDIYICPFCDETFQYKIGLNGHLSKSHPNFRPFHCVCGKNFATKSALSVHVKRVHSDERPFQCEVCGKKFKTNGELSAHMQVHSDFRPFHCVCGKSFKTKKQLHQHMVRHSDETPFQCGCGKKFKSKRELSSHTKVHTNLRHFHSVCGKSFKTKADLKRHMIGHSNEMSFQCERVKKFKTKTHLSLNVRVRSKFNGGKGYKSFHCENCNYGEKEHSYAKPKCCKDCRKIRKSTPYECAVCKEPCETLFELYEHEQSHWLYQCSLCPNRLKSQTDLDKHLEIIHWEHVCTLCNKKYESQTHLDEHTETNHSPYVCIPCVKCFRSQSDLNEHRMVIHHLCTLCGILCKSQIELDEHEKWHWLYQCSRENLFKSQTNLKKHEIIQSKCTQCGKLCKSWIEMNEHEKYHLWNSKLRKVIKDFYQTPNCTGKV